MSKNVQTGDVIFSEDGETLLYGWLEADEALKAIENYFNEAIQPSDVKEIKRGLWKYVPCRNNSDGYPGLYYPCENKTRGTIKATLVILK